MATATATNQYSVDELIHTLRGLGFQLAYRGTDRLLFAKGGDKLHVDVPDPGDGFSEQYASKILNEAVSIMEKKFPSLKP
jgi:hypothetical protein